MEEVMTPRTCQPSPLSTSIVMHKQSHAVSKLKRNIRIVHLIAPEVIKTDVENFRELVQRLTGKPASARKCIDKNKKKKVEGCSIHVMDSNVSESSNRCEERVKEEEMRGKKNSGFFGGFGDLGGFTQGMTEFPLSMTSSHVDAFRGEDFLC
ncbi:hypothetical protein MRB53_006987 [Persea americana]|uniref:Uncharacterized protein n=1 Tax=Persea americana TaxID=3435 RepID=A0ACC2MIR9_PERAE|nr:hypothetical protein MRB53_006987 [Persea americana]